MFSYANKYSCTWRITFKDITHKSCNRQMQATFLFTSFVCVSVCVCLRNSVREPDVNSASRAVQQAGGKLICSVITRSPPLRVLCIFKRKKKERKKKKDDY